MREDCCLMLRNPRGGFESQHSHFCAANLNTTKERCFVACEENTTKHVAIMSGAKQNGSHAAIMSCLNTCDSCADRLKKQHADVTITQAVYKERWEVANVATL